MKIIKIIIISLLVLIAGCTGNNPEPTPVVITQTTQTTVTTLPTTTTTTIKECNPKFVRHVYSDGKVIETFCLSPSELGFKRQCHSADQCYSLEQCIEGYCIGFE